MKKNRYAYSGALHDIIGNWQEDITKAEHNVYCIILEQKGGRGFISNYVTYKPKKNNN